MTIKANVLNVYIRLLGFIYCLSCLINILSVINSLTNLYEGIHISTC